MSEHESKTPPEHDAAFRHQWWEHILAHAEPWHHDHLARLFELWQKWNGDHFGGLLVPPYILLAEPSNPRRLGDTASTSGFGGHCQIRLRPSLLRGTHPLVHSGDDFAEGRFRFVADVLLHEMVHQWQQESTGKQEPGYNGHGPSFAAKANQIGTTLGLGPVRTGKRRGKNADLPSCAYWLHNVRPADHYLGAYPVKTVPTSRDKHCPTCTCDNGGRRMADGRIDKGDRTEKREEVMNRE